jgi:pimeloyl-ACP methyl ester carboxylesterase
MESSLPPALAQWRSRGRLVRVGSHDIFVLTEGASAGGAESGAGAAGDLEPLLLLHGFPSSSYDFHLVLPRLADHHTVVVHDHLGFGLSDKPVNYSYSLMEQADVALAVWRSLGIKRGHLIAHDYGTSVATELMARAARGLLPIELASVTLSNGSVHIALAQLTPSQKLLRAPYVGPLFAGLARPALFKAQIRRILGDAGSVSDEELELMWAAMARDDGKARLPAISSYLDERRRFSHRWTEALLAWQGPAHVLWGDRDPIAVMAIAERLASELRGSKLTWLHGLGHYPMLESPERWSSALLSFLDGDGRARS